MIECAHPDCYREATGKIIPTRSQSNQDLPTINMCDEHGRRIIDQFERVGVEYKVEQLHMYTIDDPLGRGSVYSRVRDSMVEEKQREDKKETDVFIKEIK